MNPFVLVHGTCAGGWQWQAIAGLLRQAGHDVFTPTLTGLGERVHLASPAVNLDTHITDVENVIRFEALDDVVLVGHSFGGMVISGVAERIPERIARLVYLDGLVPHDDEGAIDLIGADNRAEREECVRTLGDGWFMPPPRSGTRATAHPWASWTQPVRLGNPAAKAIPRIYIRLAADKRPGSRSETIMRESWKRARSEGWPTREIRATHSLEKDPQLKADALLAVLGDL